MSIDELSKPPLRHLATFVSSGTFSVPDGMTKVYATVESATGVPAANSSAQSGAVGRGSGYVEVVPGKTALVVVGAGGASQGASGGTTSFDGAIIAPGSNGGNYHPEHGSGGGSTPARTFQTSLASDAPPGATVRVTGTSTSAGPTGNSQSGKVHIYG